jgi:hypothetical protein
MAGIHDKKQRITEALAGVRIQVQDQLLLLWRKLNFGRHILESIRRHPWEWTSLAAGFGWLLSRLPARKKKIYIYTNQEQVKGQGKKVLSKMWKSVWRTSKPLIAAYAAKKLAEKVKSYKSGTAMNGI